MGERTSDRLDWVVEQLTLGPTTAVSLATLAGVTAKVVREWLARLVKDGHVERRWTRRTGKR